MNRATIETTKFSCLPNRSRSVQRALLEALDTRRLLCGLSHEFLIDPPKWSDAVEAEVVASRGPESPEATSIVWTNRGNITDGFSGAFGTSASAARAVVDAALDHWERVFTNWNRANGTSTLQVSISISGSGFGGAAAPDATAPGDGKPITGSVTLGAGNVDADPNNSNGWYFDPNPNDHGEFNGTINNAFALTGSGLGPDLYSVVVAELAHVLGLISDRDNAGGSYDGYLLESSGFVTNTNIADTAEGNGNGKFWVFDGPTIDHLMTSFNSGDPTANSWGNIVHTSGPGPAGGLSFAGKTWYGSDDAGNAFYSTNERTLPSFVAAHVLADAYGYSMVEPQTFGTAYALLNESNGQLLVRGGLLASEDVITINFDGNDYTVSVDVGIDPPGTGPFSGTQNLPAWVSSFSAAEVSSIVIEAGGGDDDVFVNGTDAAVTVNAGSGDDFISVGGGDIDTNLDANVSVVAGDGTDTLWLDDTADGAGGDNYYITVSRVEKNNDLRRVYYEQFEVFTLLGSNQPSEYEVAFLPAGLSAASIAAGSGNDAFTVGSGDIDTHLDSNVTLTGGGGTDTLIFDDTTDGPNSDIYELTSSRLTKAPLGSNRFVQFSGMNSIRIDGSEQASDWNILSVPSSAPVTLNGGSGTENFTFELTSNLANSVVVNAGPGNDSLVLGGAGDDLDRALANTVDWRGQGGDDHVSLDDSGDASTAAGYVLTGSSLTKSTSTGSLTMAGTETIHLVANAGSNTITVEFGNLTQGQRVTVGGGQGDDTITSLSPGTVSLLEADVTLTGGAGTDTIRLDDSLGSVATGYELTDSTFQSVVVAFTGVINYTAENFELTAGAQSTNIRIQSTTATTDYTLNAGDGNDTFTFGGPGRDVSGLLGEVFVHGQGGSDRLQYNDDNYAVGSTYVVSTNSFGRSGVANVDPTSVEEIVLNTSTGADLINVSDTFSSAVTTVNGGLGNDTFRVATGLWDTGIQGAVTVNGGNGFDEIQIDDSNDPGADGYAVTATQATKNSAFAAPIDYNTVEQFVLEGNNSANTININGTFLGTILIYGNDGNDTINLVDHAAGANVIIDGGPQRDNVSVNADNVGVATGQFSVDQDLNQLAIGSGGTARLNTGGLLLDVQGAVSQGTLDLTDGGYIDRGGTSIQNAYVTQLTSGYNGGAWNGAAPAILSSTAAGSALSDGLGYAGAGQIGVVTFMGVSVAANDLLVRYTLNGDTNLDRAVNIGDFANLAANFNTAANWFRGDFNYDASTNIADFSLLAANFNQVLTGTPATSPTGSSARKSPFSHRRLIEEVQWLDRPGTGG